MPRPSKKKRRRMPPEATGAGPGATKLARRGLATEERTLRRLESLPSPGRGLATAVYLVGAYWPWWLALFLGVLVLSRLARGSPTLTSLAIALGAVALFGYFAKLGLERYAEGLPEPDDED